eukprot:6030804-Prymnesium_polylepis.1
MPMFMFHVYVPCPCMAYQARSVYSGRERTAARHEDCTKTPDRARAMASQHLQAALRHEVRIPVLLGHKSSRELRSGSRRLIVNKK